MDYQEAIEKLGNRESRKLDNNTYLQRRDASTVAVKLHDTDVVTFRANGAVILSSGGWRTPTTKARINDYSPLSVSQANGVWYVRNGNAAGEVTFADGITYRAGKFTHCGPVAEKQQKDRKRVRQFAAAFMTALLSGKVPHPSAGDCFFCGLKEVGTGKPLGECSGNSDHIASHLKEKYYVPSLLINALKAGGAGSMWFDVLNAFWKENWEMEQAQQMRKSYDHMPKFYQRMLTRYLYRQLGMVR